MGCELTNEPNDEQRMTRAHVTRNECEYGVDWGWHLTGNVLEWFGIIVFNFEVERWTRGGEFYVFFVFLELNLKFDIF